MQRTYIKKKIPKSVQKEINKLSSVLPEMDKIGVFKSYHQSKLNEIYLRKYKASSAKARDIKTVKEFEAYCTSIYSLQALYLEQVNKGGFKPFKILEGSIYTPDCVICKAEGLQKVSKAKEDKRVSCGSCGAFYAANGDTIEVFYEQVDISIEDAEIISDVSRSVIFEDADNVSFELDDSNLENFKDIFSSIISKNAITDEAAMAAFNSLPDKIKFDVMKYDIDTCVGDEIYLFLKDSLIFKE